MDQRTAQNIRLDFADWSGGFPPASPAEITVYIDYSMPIDFTASPTEARKELEKWMNDQHRDGFEN